MSEWPHSQEWLDQEYAQLRELGIEGDFDLESVGAPINPGGYSHACPGCGSGHTAFGSSMKVDNRWTCHDCGLVFDSDYDGPVDVEDNFVPW